MPNHSSKNYRCLAHPAPAKMCGCQAACVCCQPGSTGPAGAQGPQGPTGPAGIGLPTLEGVPDGAIVIIEGDQYTIWTAPPLIQGPLQPSYYGLIAYNYDPLLSKSYANAQNTTSYLITLQLTRSLLVTGISVGVYTAGSNPVAGASYFAIYNGGFNLVTQTADVGVLLETTGLVYAPITGTITSPLPSFVMRRPPSNPICAWARIFPHLRTP